MKCFACTFLLHMLCWCNVVATCFRPGYYGSQCETLCPSGYVCNGDGGIELCESATMQGTSVCSYSVCSTSRAATRSRVWPVHWSSSTKQYTRIHNDTCGCAHGPVLLDLDFGSKKQLSGLVIESENGHLQSWFVEDDNFTRVGGLYTWNSVFLLDTVLFPHAVVTQSLRIIIMDYVSAYSYPKLRMAALDDPCCVAGPLQNCTVVNSVPVVQPCDRCGCANGFLSRDSGATCEPCPAGFMCNSAVGVRVCEKEYYCPTGSSEMTVCL